MMYSAALWTEGKDGPCGDIIFGPTDGALEAAQYRKIQYFLRKARLKSGDRVLEIGCGWGAMAIEVRSLTRCVLQTFHT